MDPDLPLVTPRVFVTCFIWCPWLIIFIRNLQILSSKGHIKLPAVGIMKIIRRGGRLDCLMTAPHVGKNEAVAKMSIEAPCAFVMQKCLLHCNNSHIFFSAAISQPWTSLNVAVVPMNDFSSFYWRQKTEWARSLVWVLFFKWNSAKKKHKIIPS